MREIAYDLLAGFVFLALSVTVIFALVWLAQWFLIELVVVLLAALVFCIVRLVGIAIREELHL